MKKTDFWVVFAAFRWYSMNVHCECLLMRYKIMVGLNSKQAPWWLVVYCGCIVALGYVMVGCESSTTDADLSVYVQGTEESTAEVEVGQYDAVYLEVDPSTVETGSISNNALFLPLKWSVHPRRR